MLKTYERHHKSPVEVGGTPLTMKKGGLYKATLNDRNVLINPGMLIVPQELAEKSEPYMSVLNGMFSGDKKAGYDAYVDDMAKIKEFDYVSQKDVQVEIISNKLISSYIGSYLGITFLVTAGAVLALQQLSQSADNKKDMPCFIRWGRRLGNEGISSDADGHLLRTALWNRGRAFRGYHGRHVQAHPILVRRRRGKEYPACSGPGSHIV